MPVVRNKDRINKDSILTGIVRAEYPSDKRFDIAIIDPRSERKATKRDDRNDLFWKQNLLGAIELKYSQLGDDLDDKMKKFSRDIKKLKNYKNPEIGYTFEFGLALLFTQEDNLNLDFIRRKYSETKQSPNVGQVSDIEGYIITKGAKYKVI